ncbi:MAG: ABC transporter permease [Aerococcus sp.]|nr:ABC transporter permease [Aerococcus sp.]
MGAPDQFTDVTTKDQTIIPQKQVEELLMHENPKMTIGLDKGSANQLYSIPQLLFTTPVVMDRIDAVFDDTHHLNGTYYINGLTNPEDKQLFLKELANISGTSVTDLTTKKFGRYLDPGIVPIILSVMIAADALVLLVLFLMCVLRSFQYFGTLILLGWSKGQLWMSLFRDFLLFSVYITPVISLIAWIVSGWTRYDWQTWLSIFGTTSVSIILLILTLIIPSLIIYQVSPLAAIHKRLPMHFLLVSGLLFYAVVSVGLITVSHSLDAPMNQFAGNIQVAREWKNVENMYVISNITEGNDAGTYAGTTNTLENSMYRFYQRIADIPGVYIAHGEYSGRDRLNNIIGAYKDVPRQPFWELTYSYNYLQDMGFTLSKEDVATVKDGTRLYLLPDTMNEKDLETMKAYLQEDVRVKESDIQTPFTQDQKFVFKTYHPSQEIFTWSTNTKQGVTRKDPIIFVAAPENLYFMETANLYVTGFNGLLKIRDKQTMDQVQQILKNEFPDLNDNQLQFTTVKNYINGLQKDLGYTFYLFGSTILIIIVLLLAIFWSLVLIYRLIFEERLNVQYFLGFSGWQRYRPVVLLVVGLTVIELIASILLKSRLGVVFTLIAFVSQWVLLYVSFMRRENDRVMQWLKG